MNQNQSFRREHLAMADGSFGWRGLGEVRMMDENTVADHPALDFTNHRRLQLTTFSTISLCTGEISTAKRAVFIARNGDHTGYHQGPKAY